MPPNREIEVKLLVHDLEAIRRNLRAMQARRVARVYEQNTLFDTQDEYFRRHRSILRIRIEEKACARARRDQLRQQKPASEGLLTFKCLPVRSSKGSRAARSRYKERDEIEYRLPDASRFGRLLQRLGLRAWFRYEKYRSRYRIAGSALHIDLDETPIGAFLELEGPRRSIDRAAKALGYSPGDYITASYLELYASERARRGLPVANMVFSAKKLRIPALCA